MTVITGGEFFFLFVGFGYLIKNSSTRYLVPLERFLGTVPLATGPSLVEQIEISFNFRIDLTFISQK